MKTIKKILFKAAVKALLFAAIIIAAIMFAVSNGKGGVISKVAAPIADQAGGSVSSVVVSTAAETEPSAGTTAAPASEEAPATAADAKQTTGTRPEDEWHYRGYVIDRNGVILIYNDGIMRVIDEGCNVSHANLLDSYNSSLSVDRVFEDDLRTDNPTPTRTNDGHLMGQSVVLTLDSSLQNGIYQYMEANRIIGSVTVLGGGGEVRALVSYPSYDANADFSTLNIEPHCCLNRCVEPARPGSAFKMLSAVTADYFGIHDYSDPGYLEAFGINNWDCRNKPYSSPVSRTLRQGVRASSNCWFADAFYSIGASDVKRALDKFFCFSSPLECDFVTLSNTIQLDTPSNLAFAGFGQRENVSPLYLAMCANAVVTGELNLPYIADRTVDTVTLKDISVLGAKKTLSELNGEYTDELLLGMQDVSADLGLKVAEGRQLYSKTGTAETSDDMSKNDIHYIVSVMTDAERSAGSTTAVVFQYINSPAEYASGDKQHMQAILDTVGKHE